MTSGLCIASMATVGTFDGLHCGHQQILRRLRHEAAARQMHSLLVTFDRHPRQVIGRTDDNFRLLSTHDERLALLAASGVDEVRELAFSPQVAEQSACRFLEEWLVGRWGVQALLLGYDNSFGCRHNNDFDHLPEVAKSLGVELIIDTPFHFEGKEVSSTRIRLALAQGDMQSANAMLGRPYSVTGIVVKGRGVGRQLRFPTANILPDDPLKALPSKGVYAVEVVFQERTWRGMANLGDCPTFGLSQPSFEVHLLDFDGDLYGQSLTVRFLLRLRDIVRFDSPEALAAQLAQDRDRVNSIITLL